MRISDWSSDVCSSDLGCPLGPSIAAVWRLREPRSRALSRLGSLKDIVPARRIPAALGQPRLRRLKDGQQPRRHDADVRLEPGQVEFDGTTAIISDHAIKMETVARRVFSAVMLTPDPLQKSDVHRPAHTPKPYHTFCPT